MERIIDTGEPRIINDLAIYARQNPDSKSTRLILAEGIRSSLTCPLVAMGRPIGFLFFSSELPDSYRSVHTDVFLRLSTVVSVGLEKSILYEELSQLTNDLRAAHQELEFKAHHDGLTGLLNRTAVVRAANDRLSDNRLSSRGGVAVCMLDIDHFKVINDQHGHIVGDRVLQQVADAISPSTGADDIVGRYGG